jgi:hypothetical protein
MGPRLVSHAPACSKQGDAVTDWFERCLDLHGGLGRAVQAAS